MSQILKCICQKGKKRDNKFLMLYICLFLLHSKLWDCLWCCSFPFFFPSKMLLKLMWGLVVMQYKVNLAGHCC